MEIITVTEKGKIQLLKLMNESNVSSETHYLRVGVKGGGCSGLSYELGFDTLKDDSDNLIETEPLLAFMWIKNLNKVKELTNFYDNSDSKIKSARQRFGIEIKSLGGQVADLEALKVQLEQDKASLKNSNHATIASYEAKIKEYNVVLSTKDGEIVELKKQNGILTESNQTLTTQNTTLNTENSGLKTQFLQLYLMLNLHNNDPLHTF